VETAAYLGLEIEGPDHAQCEDDTDDSKKGDGADVETDANLRIEIEGPDHSQCEDDTDDSKQRDGGDEKGIALIISSSILRH